MSQDVVNVIIPTGQSLLKPTIECNKLQYIKARVQVLIIIVGIDIRKKWCLKDFLQGPPCCTLGAQSKTILLDQNFKHTSYVVFYAVCLPNIIMWFQPDHALHG